MMAVFEHSLNKIRLAILASLLITGCDETLEPITGISSLEVQLLSPSETGSRAEPLPDGTRNMTLSIRAMGADGEIDTSLNGELDIYVHYLGGLTPSLDTGDALQRINMVNGIVDSVDLTLPVVYGKSLLWVQDVSRENASYVLGTSPELWFRDPVLADISRPEDEQADDALRRSPLEAKQVLIDSSRYGARGRMIVTGVYAQGFTVSDVECADEMGTPPCTTGEYDHLYIYSFSRPVAEDGRSIVVGDTLTAFRGVISEYLGLTEVGFPSAELGEEKTNLARIPAPALIDKSWFTNKINFERVEAALVEIKDAKICALDDSYSQYFQWKLDIGEGCRRDAISIISQGQVAGFDPAQHVGETISSLVGTLRPVNISSSFNVWIVHPRSVADITLQ